MATAGPLPSSTGGPDISLIHKLTNINDVNRLLHETVAKERSIDADLDKLLSKRAELERSFLLLNAPTVEMLELVHADCEQLLSSASSTAELATHISSKVRCLDTVQTAVGSVLGKISLILDCSAAISGVQTAMEAEDYESAAHHIATFTELDARLAAGGCSSRSGQGIGGDISADFGQAESQRQVLMEAKQKLEAVVSKQLDDAVARRDVAAAVRFAKLYKPLGRQAEGLKKFVEFLQLVVGAQVRTHIASISEQVDSGKKLDWAAALSVVFKDVAEALQAHEAFVTEAFGAAAVVDLVTGLQVECDHAGGRVIGRFMEARRLAALVKEAASRRNKGAAATSGPGGGGGAGEQGLDHRKLEQSISELLGLCRVTEEYNQFMLGRMRQAAGGSLTATRETSFRSGALNVGMRELLGHYMALEEMYMYDTSGLAIRIDEVSSGSLTSSMVDDVFYILRKVGTRVLATGSMQVMCALLMEVANVAANPLRNALATRLAAGPNKLLAAAPLEGSDDMSSLRTDITSLPPAAADYVVALNNSDVAAEYMAKLKAELEGYIGDLFPAHPAAGSERERVRGVLQELHKTAGELRQAASRAVEQLAEGVLPRLRPALDQAAGASYSLTEAEYSAGDAGSAAWVQHLVLSLRGAMVWMQPLLTTTNYEGCVGAVLDKLVSRLEALLSRKTFTQLGGLALERDLRMLVSHVSDLTQRSIRDKFTRLNQMALVLGLESVDELRDYWGVDSSITWRLSGAEVKAVLAQRPDMPRDALNVLHLG